MTVSCVLVGCGQVAEQYVATLAADRWTEVTACVDVDPVRAEVFADRHGVPWAGTPDRYAEMPRVDLAVVLTPPATHRLAAEQVMPHVRAVHVEKPIATTLPDARHLVATAHAHGVLLGAAPDTLIAPWFRAARAALADGRIGDPVSAAAALLTAGPERWHPRPQVFYTEDTGPLLDMGPYYLNTVVALLGPVTRVVAAHDVTRPLRRDRAGRTFRSTVATHCNSLLEMASGVPVTLTTSFDVPVTRTPHLEVHGTDGTLVLPDPNWYDGTALLRGRGGTGWTELDVPGALPTRGVGAVHAAHALLGRASTPPSAERAVHVLAVMIAIRDAAARGGPVDVPDRFDRKEQVARGHHEGQR